jgi:hypothetical protein
MGHADTIQPDDEKAPLLRLTSLKYAPEFMQLIWEHLHIGRTIRRHEARLAGYLRRFSVVDPRLQSDGDLWSGLEHWTEVGPEFMQTVFLLTNVTMHESPVRTFCERVGFPFEQLVFPQLAIGQRSVSAQQAFDLVELAEAAAASRPLPSSSRAMMPARRICGPRSAARRFSPHSIASSSATDIVGATNPTGRCRATRKIPRPS